MTSRRKHSKHSSEAVNMKYIFFIALFVFSAQEVLMSSPPSSCLARLCAEEFKPVCGKQKVGECWDVQIFNSSCLMDSENDCGKANWVPCVENKCDATVDMGENIAMLAY